jgi:benzoyl-CoA reductase/2-hydroxyglutaryl-CoA dehydratase subunit BcrC/BadD/HgdB
MNKTYHYEIVRRNGTIYQSVEYYDIDECVEACQEMCEIYGVEYCDSKVRLFLTEDFGKTYKACTEEGEVI